MGYRTRFRRVRRLIPYVGTRALVVGVSYYVGARIGFALQAPGLVQSILWLPNSILLATLLLAAPRRWPLYLAAALPAQLIVAVQSDTSMQFMALVFLTNCADAVLGASLVRWACRGRWRPDRLDDLLVFLVLGAALSPLLVSFADAAISMAVGMGASYWHVYSTRVRANTLTNVILVPAIVGIAANGLPRLRRINGQRYAEAGLLIGALLVLSVLVFSTRSDVEGLPAMLYLPLPFLLWAAVRFGPGLTGAGLFVVALISSWNAVRGFGAASLTPAVPNIAAVQFLLFCISVPLLCLAAVVQEQAAAARLLVTSETALRASVGQVRDLAGRLISAQEAERAHIARELHDGVSQHVAAMAIALSAMKSGPPERNAKIEQEVERLQSHTAALFESVRDLSHQLHPSVLRRAGLVTAMQSLCAAVSEHHEIRITLRADDIGSVPEVPALCIYRVTQEALRNAVAHSGAQSISVVLGREGDRLMLSITDDGRGFDPATARRRGGLGLVSIEERVRLEQGDLVVDSNASGTRITAWLPLEPVA